MGIPGVVRVGCLLLCVVTVSGQACEPLDCIVGEWGEWTACSHTCGEAGTRARGRYVFREAICGGQCPTDTSQEEPCNIHCCPKDCVVTAWSNWMLCGCEEDGICEEKGQRFKCRRMRAKLEDLECGGYCDSVTIEDACGALCCYQDCALDPWTAWSTCVDYLHVQADKPCCNYYLAQCEQPGYRYRQRNTYQEPMCGGGECGETYEETRCEGPCCPLDCQLGEWSPWSPCNATCGESVETRSRFVRPAACDGVQCAEADHDTETRPCTRHINVDCLVSAWSPWSDCLIHNGFCGEGSKTRQRSIITEAECQGGPCRPTEETGGVCYGPCCRQDCVVSDWGEWSHCSTDCGQGISIREREAVTLAACGGSDCPVLLLQSRDCSVTEDVDCRLTDWTAWSDCSTDCGRGQTVRTRTMITPAYCGGQCSGLHTEEAEPCEDYSARQDCQMSVWGNWSTCVRNCERGLQDHRRSVVTNPTCGGLACLHALEFRQCHDKCQQLCHEGVCSCRAGFTLRADGHSCKAVSCPAPALEYCPLSHRYLLDCRYPYFNCSEGYTYDKTCTGYCTGDGWTLKESVDRLRCTAEGTWTTPEIYCSRPNKPPLAIEIDKTTILENTRKDTCFAHLTTVTDGEDFEEHVYAVVFDATGRLYVKGSRLCLSRDADYEEPPTVWTVVLSSTDIDGASIDSVVTFEVLDTNEPPTDVKIVPNVVAENSPSGTLVGCIVGKDDDPGQTVTFALVDTDDGIFGSYEDAGRLCVKVVKDSDPRCYSDGGVHCVLNKERKGTHYVTILASDNGTPPMSAYYDVPIVMSDANDKPTGVRLDPTAIPEGIEPGQPLAEFITVDEDSNQTYTYTILADDGVFSVTYGKLTASRSFDFETDGTRQFQISVQSVDSGEPSRSVTDTVLITIQDVNEAPHDLQLSSLNGYYKFDVNRPNIPENVKMAMLGTLSVMDDDDGDTLTIELAPGTDPRFLLFGRQTCNSLKDVQVYCTMAVAVKGPFDFEVEEHVTVTITATDAGGQRAVLELRLDITDGNDPPTELLLNGEITTDADVEEHRQSAVVAVLTAVDDDADDSHTFTLTDSADGRFLIEGNTLKTSPDTVLNYEQRSEYHVKVLVTDSGQPPLAAAFPVTVHVTDVNEAPSSTMLSNNIVPENSADGTIVGSLTSEDPDGTSVFRYSLPEDSSGRFRLSGNTLLVQKSSHMCGARPCVLDYETAPEYHVTVLTMDDGSPRLQREDTFVITVTDVNDPPSDIVLSHYVVKENKPAGIFVGTLSADDQDGVQQTLVFRLDDHTDVFSIQSDGVSLATRVAMDHEAMRGYRVTVTATDNGVPVATGRAELSIRVLDVPEAPEFLNVTDISVPEDTDPSTVVAKFLLSDPDSKSTLQARVTDQLLPFALQGLACNTTPRTGATDCIVDLVLTSSLDAGRHDTYDVSVTATDATGLQSTSTFTVTVEDKNDAPTDIIMNDISATELHVRENSKGQTVGTLVTVDRDLDQTHTFTILLDTSDVFEIVTDKLKVKTTAEVDFEMQHDPVTLTIETTDSGEPPLSLNKTFTVTIDDVNEVPTVIQLTPDTVAENSNAGTTVGRLQVADPDNVAADRQTFSFVLADDANGRFTIVGDTLQTAKEDIHCLSQGGQHCSLNYETATTHTVKVKVTDSGIPPQSNTFDVNIAVTDVNDPPRNLRLTGNKVRSGSPEGTPVGQLTGDDEDSDQAVVFSLAEGGVTAVSVSDDGSVTAGLNIGDTFNITVTATDNGVPPLTASATFTLTVTGELDVTLNITADGSDSVFPRDAPYTPEHVTPGTVVGSLVAEYPMPGRRLTVQLSARDGLLAAGNTSCTDTPTSSHCTAQLLVVTDITFENTAIISVTVKAVTDDGQTFTATFDVIVKDVNESPTDIRFIGDSITVEENTKDIFIGRFYTDDPDVEDVHTYTLDSSNVFNLTTDGQLFVLKGADIDFETAPVLTVNVTSTDSGGLSHLKEFTVNVLDVNEIPTHVSLSNNKVDEMSLTGTVVGYLQTTDPDVDETFTYQLLNSADGRFKLEDQTLKTDMCRESTDDLCLDFETMSSFEIVIQVIDSGVPPQSNTFKVLVEVNDVNDAPQSMSISTTKVPEDQDIDTAVATIGALDQDSGQTITFNIISENSVFTVENDKLLLKGVIDFEVQFVYEVTVEAKDDGRPAKSVTKMFQIEVLDVNEPPHSITFIPASDGFMAFTNNKPKIGENLEPTTLIGQVITLDHDVADDDETVDDVETTVSTLDVTLYNPQCLTLTKGTRCSVDVRTGRVYDFEKEEYLNMTFTSTDTGGLQLRQEFRMTVVDANDSPTVLLLNGTKPGTISLAENARDVQVATLSAVDPDNSQTHVFAVVDGDNGFLIVHETLQVSVAADFDFERQDVLSITIRATDNGSPPQSLDTKITIKLLNVNEPPSAIFISNDQVVETAPVGQEIGVLTVKDPDNARSATQTFQLDLTDDADGIFMITGDVLMVAKAVFDYEAQQRYSVTVKVTDSGQPPLAASFPVDINVIDVNDPPRQLEFTGDDIAENSPIGTIVGKLSALDDDTDQHLMFSLLAIEHFSVDGNKVLVGGPVDYEDNGEILIQAMVTDNGDPPESIERNFTVRVTDVNEAPHSLELSGNDGLTILESAGPGAVICHVTVRDDDRVELLKARVRQSGDVLAISPSGLQCDSTTGTTCNCSLVLVRGLDYKGSAGPFSVTVIVEDKGGLTVQRSWSFSITDANEPPRDIILTTNGEGVPENVTDAFVGSLSSIDDDAADNHIYQVITHWELFSVKEAKLIATSPLDYEAQSDYRVTVLSKDDGDPPLSFEKELIIKVKDVNEAPTNITLSYMEVQTDAAVGQVVGIVTVDDPDNLGSAGVHQAHSCSLPTPSYFLFDSEDMSIKVKGTLPLNIKVFTVTIVCSDDGVPPMSHEQDLSITAVNVVRYPKGIMFTPGADMEDVRVEENSAHVTLGQLSVINLLTEVKTSGTFSYGPAAGSESWIAVVGAVVTLEEALDFESQPVVTVGVTATGTDDSGEQIDIDTKIKITVVDVNEAPTGVGIYGGGGVPENSEAGAQVGDLFTKDPDVDQGYTYTLLGVNYGFVATKEDVKLLSTFTIDNRTLRVGDAAYNIDYEESDVITLLVGTVDSGTPPLSTSGLIRLHVTDVNDPPTDITLSASTVDENSPSGTLVGELTVTDQDVGQQHACEVLNLNAVPFQITNRTSLVVASDTLDYEGQRVHSVQVTCGDTILDGTRLRYTKTFTINVTNVNEPPVNLSLTSLTVEEHKPAGQLIGELKAVDLDSPKVLYTIEDSAAAELFAIQGDGTLTSKVVFAYEQNYSYELPIKAADDEGAFITRTFTIQVLDVNEQPTAILLDDTTIPESSPAGTLVGRLSTVDPDSHQGATYTIHESDVEEGYFDIHEDSLVTGTRGLDYEAMSEHVVVIRSTDDGEPSKFIEVEFKVQVTDDNEPPTEIVVGAIEPVREDAAPHARVASLHIVDPDPGQKHACQLEAGPATFSVLMKSDSDLGLYVVGQLDFETATRADLTVVCTDGQFPVTKNISIPIVNVNERPSAIQLSGSNMILADAGVDDVVGDLTAVDEDIGQTYTFTIAGPNSDLLQINAQNSLVMKATVPVHHFDTLDPSIKFTITVADNGDPVLTHVQNFSLPITHVEVVTDQLPAIVLDHAELPEDADSGYEVGRLYSDSTPIDDSIVFTVKENHEGLFAVTDNAILTLTRNLSGVEAASIQVTLQVENTDTFETATKTITLVIIRIKTCESAEVKCDDNARCVHLNTSVSQCQCNADYVGDGKSCDQIDNCLTAGDDDTPACENDGICRDDVNSHVCVCQPGYGGQRCEIDQSAASPCSPDPCLHEAVCVPTIAPAEGFTCSCQPGWSGDTCDVSSDDCVDGACAEGGTCVDSHLTYTCTCPPHRRGWRCQYGVDTCSTPRCNDTHVCVRVVSTSRDMCLHEDMHKVTLRYSKQKYSDVPSFASRLSSFIVEYGRLARSTNDAARRKRAAEEPESAAVEVYMLEAAEDAGGQMVYSFVVIDAVGNPFTKQEVLDILSSTCEDINAGDLTEVVFCPAIVAAARQPAQSPSSDSSSSVGVIVGVIVALLVVAAVVVVVVYFVMKTKKEAAVAPQEGPEPGREAGQDEGPQPGREAGPEPGREAGPDGDNQSRRSSGYSSLTRLRLGLSKPHNRVSPTAMPDGDNVSNASELVPLPPQID